MIRKSTVWDLRYRYWQIMEWDRLLTHFSQLNWLERLLDENWLWEFEIFIELYLFSISCKILVSKIKTEWHHDPKYSTIVLPAVIQMRSILSLWCRIVLRYLTAHCAWLFVIRTTSNKFFSSEFNSNKARLTFSTAFDKLSKSFSVIYQAI